ncbi:MAG: chloride channel protein [Phycisphaerales bacterium]|nr:MAG: chloride channel protein [Phycisphaerales bacterium]
MPTALTKTLRLLSTKLGFEADWYLVLIAAGIGVFTAAVAMAFIELIHLANEIFHQASTAQLLWLTPLLPMVGALIAGVIIHFVAREAKGHGVPEVLHAIHGRKGLIKARVALGKWTSAVFSIGSGGSAGAEGPIVQIGSALGSKLGQLLKINPQNTTTLLGCGAAAGIASVFNAPIAGIFFVLEILLRDFSIRTFTPIVIASVFSAATTQAVRGWFSEAADQAARVQNVPIFELSENFNQGAFYPAEIPNYVVMGLLCGLVALAFIKALYWTEDLYDRIKLHPIIKPVTGAALLGVLGLCYLWFFVKPDSGMPPFFSNGYPVIKELLSIGHYRTGEVGGLFWALVLLCVFKAFATCLTLGSGGSGGIFAPSLMLGACAGGAFGVLVNHYSWIPYHASPAHYALVGMAAVVAATTHAPLTAILIVYEITRSYHIILPLMLAAVISTVIVRLIMPHSIYTLKLARRGIHLGAMSDLTILRRLVVNDVPLAPPVVVHPDDSAQRLLDLSEEKNVNDFVVADEQNHYIGLVTGADLKEALVYREAIPLLQVNELQRTDLPTVTPDETLDIVMDKFSAHDVQSLAVLSADDDGAVLGLITRSRLMRHYQLVLSRH